MLAHLKTKRLSKGGHGLRERGQCEHSFGLLQPTTGELANVFQNVKNATQARILKLHIYLSHIYSNVGLGSSLRGEPGLTTFRSQGCPWKIISGLRQSNTHRGGTQVSSIWQKKSSNCSNSVQKLTLLLAVSQKISAKIFRPWLLGRPRLLCC